MLSQLVKSKIVALRNGFSILACVLYFSILFHACMSYASDRWCILAGRNHGGWHIFSVGASHGYFMLMNYPVYRYPTYDFLPLGISNQVGHWLSVDWVDRRIPAILEQADSWPLHLKNCVYGVHFAKASEDGRVADVTWIVVSVWIPLAVLLPFFLWATRVLHHSFRSMRRVRQGCCAFCGYDLRETPVRCPECGELAAGRVSSNLRTDSF